MTSSRSSLQTAYLESRELLLRLFTRRSGDPAAAEDIVQDLWLRVEQADIHSRVDNPVAFLLRMANNLYLNRLRSATSGRSRDRAWHDASFEAAGEEVVTGEPTPEAQVASRQQLLLLVETLKELPDRTQAIFHLHKIEGLGQAEVAARLDISVSSVEKHLAAALKHLLWRMRQKNGE